MDWTKILQNVAPNIAGAMINPAKFAISTGIDIIKTISETLFGHKDATAYDVQNTLSKMSPIELKSNLKELDCELARINLEQKKIDVTIAQQKCADNADNRSFVLTLADQILSFFNSNGLKWFLVLEITSILFTITFISYTVVSNMLLMKQEILSWAMNQKSTEMIMHVLSSQDNILFMVLGGITALVTPRALRGLSEIKKK